MSEETQAAERLARIEAALHTVAEKQTELGAYLPMIVSELRKRDEELQAQINNRTMFCAAQAPVYLSLVKAVEDHDDRIKILEKALTEIIQINKILKWILGVATAALVVLLSALLTGQVQVIFP